MPDAAQLPLHVFKLVLDGLQPLALLSGHAVRLLGHHLDQIADVALSENVGANLGDNELLEAAGVERGSLAGVPAELDVRLADVVGVLAALGEPADERRVARLALEQAAEQVGASDSAGVAELGCPGAQALADALQLGLGDDGGKRLLHPHRVGVVLGVCAPDQGPRFLIDTKNCGTRGGWAWRLLKVTAPRLLASDVPTAAPKGDGRKTYQAAPVPPATGRWQQDPS